MPNAFFKFKQFTVYHDRCAMKVGTDGVLLGAWANTADCKTVLDIGTGSGVIALMMAQRSESNIHAVEIDHEAFLQAKENIARSEWKERIIPAHNSFQQFAAETKQRYDLIISNPPFFRNSLKSPEKERTVARHDDQLSFEDLLSFSSALLNENGRLAIIIPYELTREFTALAISESLFCIRRTFVKSKPGTAVIRSLMEFSKNRKR